MEETKCPEWYSGNTHIHYYNSQFPRGCLTDFPLITPDLGIRSE